MEKGPEKKEVLSLIILTVIPLLFLVVAFTWESMGDSPLHLLIPHQQSWGGKSNVSNTSAPSSQIDLAVGGTDIHAVWVENTGLNAKIRFKNKAKEDTNWSSAVDLATSGYCYRPAIGVVDNGTNDRIHVVWDDDSQVGYTDILYRSSTGGSTWDGPFSITSDTYNATHPDIATTSAIPHVVWHGAPTGNTKIFYSKNPSGDGLTWTTPYAVSTLANTNEFPAIAIDGSNNIHVTWHDFSNQIIQYRRSTDGGDNWDSVTDLTSGDDSSYPDVAAKGNDVYVVWNTDLGSNRYEVWCLRRAGSLWSTATTIATVTTASISDYPTPRVSIDSSDTVHVAWHALGTTDKQEIWYSQSTNYGADWSSAVNISQNSDESSQVASIGTDSEGDAHVAWQELSSQWDVFHIRTGVAGGIYLPIIMKNY